MNKLPNMGAFQGLYDMMDGKPAPKTKDVSNIVTGTVLFRDQGLAPTGDGRKMVLVIGMIAVPAGSKTFTSGRMAAVGELVPLGMPQHSSALSGDTMLMISKSNWAPFTRDGSGHVELVDMLGQSPDSLVTLPIWRV